MMRGLEEIARHLGGRRSGNGWSCRCPVHEDHNPSLSINIGTDGKLLVRCHRGCDPLIILAKLRALGLSDHRASAPVDRLQNVRDATADAQRKRNYALKIWNESQDAAGTLVERYLRERGYIGSIPPTIRFHPRLRHYSSGLYMPAMVSAITFAPGREVQAIHRTYLSENGAKKACVEPNKQMLGSVLGGAVRLTPAGTALAVVEGIETGFSVYGATNMPTWAALSAVGIENLVLPALPVASEIIIWADNDRSGIGQSAARKAAQRWIAEGRLVRIAIPPKPGTDFNDLLQEGAQ